MRFIKLPFIFLSTVLCVQAVAQKGTELFDDSYVHEIRINFFETQFWDTLKQRYKEDVEFSGSDILYLEADMLIDNQSLDSVGVRLKGKSSYYYAPTDKKPFKIDLNEFVKGQKFDGMKKINLHNGMGDPGMQRDFLCYKILRESGVNAPRVSYTKLYLNDTYWGLYAIVEQVDKTFLKNNFADGNGNLFKNLRWSNLNWLGSDPTAYQETYELKTNEEGNDWTDFIEFIDVVNNSTDEEFPSAIEEVFDVDRFLHVLAVDVMTNNWDSYIDNERNWYLYHEPESGKFQWIPWDYNLAMGGKLTVKGDPNPPYELDCPIQTTIKYSIDQEGKVNFREYSDPPAQSWLWEFGDGTISTEQNPVHQFEQSGEIEVCLTSSRISNDDLCQQTYCKIVDINYGFGSCTSIQDGSCPYPPNDPLFQQVVLKDDYCCSDSWDVFCEISYIEMEENQVEGFESGVDYSLNFPLIIQNEEKVLVHRLMNVPLFRERYLQLCCHISNNAFSTEALLPVIERNANLLRDAIFEDDNYLYTRNYFEYDIGNGTGGGEVKIPALQYFLENRILQIQDAFNSLEVDCSLAGGNPAWQSVVINEFVADNSEGSGNADPSGEYDDWIELYNNTDETIDLFGYYLSDDSSILLDWPFPQGTTIEPHGYLIIWADKDISQDGLHADFKLSKEGEEITLSHEDGSLIDSLSFGQQQTNWSSARIPNGTGDMIQTNPTFNDKNEYVASTRSPLAETGVVIYPNPANEFLNIDFSNSNFKNKSCEIRLINAIGQLVFQIKAVSAQKQIIPLHQINQSGLYLLELENETEFFIHRIMVSKS
ncbi:MAG: T9SS type A sorting domain-containing protein [Bacteroidetes bacterium]|nr:T9SS type A sorting domain-containing protein [Bacteroidota bacterium]